MEITRVRKLDPLKVAALRKLLEDPDAAFRGPKGEPGPPGLRGRDGEPGAPEPRPQPAGGSGEFPADAIQILAYDPSGAMGEPDTERRWHIKNLRDLLQA